MTAHRFHASAPDRWAHPRRPLSESERRHHHGKLQPMREPGFLARLFGKAP